LADLQDRTGGFTEFVALPFIHTNAPIYLAGIARAGATWRENRVVHAMARLALHGRIDNIQCSWVKLGDDGTVAMLRGGANDLGGTLMEETISRMAGSQHGSARTIEQLQAVAAAAGRARPPADDGRTRRCDRSIRWYETDSRLAVATDADCHDTVQIRPDSPVRRYLPPVESIGQRRAEMPPGSADPGPVFDR